MTSGLFVVLPKGFNMPQTTTTPKPQNKTPVTLNGKPGFTLRSKLIKAIGDNGRYASNAVRAIPSAGNTGVFLQATDGSQAVCLYRPGHLPSEDFVPPDVLPTRQLSNDIVLESDGDHWRSSEGRIAPRIQDARFPPVTDVLPEIEPRPFVLPPSQAQSCRNQRMVLALDVDLLRKVADSFGSSKLTLMIPPPMAVGTADDKQMMVNQAVSICPALDDPNIEGIAVIMPVQPQRATGYYHKMRQLLQASERRRKRG